MVRYAKIFSLTIMLILGVQASVFALTNEELFQQFTFNFLTPGARATALGGAFIGLADDATAVESNPAGLTQLLSPELSIEYKHISNKEDRLYENLSPESQHITTREVSDSVQSLPFLSAAFPYTLKKKDSETDEEKDIIKFVFSLYRQELVDYSTAFKTSQAPIWIPGSETILPGTNIVLEGPFAFNPVDASAKLSVTNYGIGLAMEFPFLSGLSLAVSPRWSELEMDSQLVRYDGDIESTTDIVEATDFRESEIKNWTIIDGEKDSDFSMNAGMLWRFKWLEEKLHFPKFQIGAVYRSGTKFQVKEVFSWSLLADQRDQERFKDFEEFTLKVPDSFGVGLAVNPRKNLTLTLDVVHIQYEDLLEDFDILYRMYTTEENFSIDNATEIHFGVEYRLPIGERILALRGGVYNDPDHSIRFTGTTEPKIREYWEAFL